MAADTESMPDSRTAAPSKDALISKLDEMLENYLNTLDAYQKAHQQLTEHLSSGFFSLAQANFSNARGRFGQDYYDDRMQASRTIALTEKGSSVVFAVADAPEETAAETELPQDDASEKQRDTSSTSQDSKESKKLLDPIRWFGILVPPALRSAQASFVSSVGGPIPRLCTLATDLRRQEVDIGRLRKQIKKL